ncbi:MAG: nucleotidyltransferase domain-containing protein, partial [Candidatus Altiarchaeales archaeon]
LEKYMESPFEFHLVTKNEFENWYKKFILEYRKF